MNFWQKLYSLTSKQLSIIGISGIFLIVSGLTFLDGAWGGISLVVGTVFGILSYIAGTKKKRVSSTSTRRKAGFCEIR